MRRAHQGGIAERKEMIDRSHALQVARQCQMLPLSRATAYYRRQETSEEDLALMRRMDDLHPKCPFAGSRMLRNLLKGDGYRIGRTHVATQMEKIGIAALYRKPNTSRRHAAHAVYPYLPPSAD